MTDTASPNHSSSYEASTTPGAEVVSLSPLGVQVILEPLSNRKGDSHTVHDFFWMNLTLRNLPVASSIRSERRT
eukprot:scaffold13796_cov118-Isochrysis_galbana.AAC.6